MCEAGRQPHPQGGLIFRPARLNDWAELACDTVRRLSRRTVLCVLGSEP